MEDELLIATEMLKVLAAQRVRQPTITIEEMRQDAQTAWTYAEILVAERPRAQAVAKGF